MTLLEFIKAVELHRFQMGMGAIEFAAHLGVHYHTYNSFRKQQRMPYGRTMKILLDFGKSKGIDVNKLELN